jgi:hypothetical protein
VKRRGVHGLGEAAQQVREVQRHAVPAEVVVRWHMRVGRRRTAVAEEPLRMLLHRGETESLHSAMNAFTLAASRTTARTHTALPQGTPPSQSPPSVACWEDLCARHVAKPGVAGAKLLSVMAMESRRDMCDVVGSPCDRRNGGLSSTTSSMRTAMAARARGVVIYIRCMPDTSER